MELTDILPIEKWQELVTQIEHLSPLRVSVYNVDGIRIVDGQGSANDLCPAIKANPKGQAFICAVAHMNLATIARNTGKPIVEECDAGMLKMVAPVIVKDQFLGTVGGCGLLTEDGEVDTFMISKTTGISEEEINALSSGIGRLAQARIEALKVFIQSRIDEIVSQYLAANEPSA